MTIRVAIAGVGWAGSRHVEAIRELETAAPGRIAVEMLVDSDPQHLANRAAELNVDRTTTSLDEAVADLSVDAVLIASPHNLHDEQTIAASEAGKHVMVEKPMAVSVEDATRMIDAAEANGARLYVAASSVYESRASMLREIVQSGEQIGEIVFASVAAGFRAEPQYRYPGRREWLSDPAMGGSGTWLLHGIHTVAQLRFVLGEVASVYMLESHLSDFPTPEVEGTMAGLLTLESGINVALVQSCETRVGPQSGYTLFGERGTIRADNDGVTVVSRDHDEPLRLEYPEQQMSSYALEWLAFADWIEKGLEGPTTGRSERKTLAVVQAGYESAETGQPVGLVRRFGEL